MDPQQPTTTIAILGHDTLVEDILAHLLGIRGYDVRLLVPYPIGFVEELLDGVGVLLLTPGLDEDVREGFLDAMKSTHQTATLLPVLTVSPTFKNALLDAEAVSVPWQTLFRALVEKIEDTLWPEGTAGEPPAEAAAG